MIPDDIVREDFTPKDVLDMISQCKTAKAASITANYYLSIIDNCWSDEDRQRNKDAISLIRAKAAFYNTERHHETRPISQISKISKAPPPINPIGRLGGGERFNPSKHFLSTTRVYAFLNGKPVELGEDKKVERWLMPEKEFYKCKRIFERSKEYIDGVAYNVIKTDMPDWLQDIIGHTRNSEIKTVFSSREMLSSVLLQLQEYYNDNDTQHMVPGIEPIQREPESKRRAAIEMVGGQEKVCSHKKCELPDCENDISPKRLARNAKYCSSKCQKIAANRRAK
jgi:hypothetical protein